MAPPDLLSRILGELILSAGGATEAVQIDSGETWSPRPGGSINAMKCTGSSGSWLVLVLIKVSSRFPSIHGKGTTCNRMEY